MTYQINNAIIGYPGNTLLEGVSMEIKNIEKIAIIGRNGCGKTTLLKIIAGKMEVDNLDSDEEFFIQKDGNPTIGYLEQINFDKEDLSVEEELNKVYDELFRMKQRMEDMEEQMTENHDDQLLSNYAKLSERFEQLGGYTYQTEMEQIFTKFGFEVGDLKRKIQSFSGGQKTKIAFVKLLLSKPDIMLLDEPTNHLDLPTIEWLEGYLKKYKHAVVIVSHDRLFLDHITDITYEIEYKKMKRYVGNYSAFVRQKRLDFEKQCKDYEAYQKEVLRLTTFIEKWKNTPTKVAMTKSKRMQIEHMVKIPKPMRYDERRFHTQFPLHKESSSEVLKVDKLKIGYDEILSEVSFTLKKKDRLAIIGENGKGKSTLLKTLVGQVSALGGEFQFGRDVEWVYFDQDLLNLNEEKTIIEEFWDEYPKLNRTEVRTILGNFLFTEEEVFQPIKQLSGGERVRLSLAKLFKKHANLLILDEPTNHLDMACKEALERMLKDYTGTLLFVTHDRYLIQSLADHLLIFHQEQVTYHASTYAEYQEKLELSRHAPQKSNWESPISNKSANRETKQVPNYEVDQDKKRMEQRLARLEEKIEHQEEVVRQLKLEYTDSDIATDFEKLGEINDKLAVEEQVLETLLLEWSGVVTKV